MIPSLLWRCPLCAAPEALVHRRRFWQADRLECTRCAARWRVRRLRGDDFYLRLDNPSRSHPMPAGQEGPLAAWYDRMKAGLRLEAISHPKIMLQPGETLYLASREAELWLAAGDPLADKRKHEPDRPHSSRSCSTVTDLPGEGKERLPAPPGEDLAVCAGAGQLFLTSQRLAWQGEAGSQDFPLSRVQGVYTILTLGLAVASGLRLVFFHFHHESPLKWTTYCSLVAAQVQAAAGSHIETSHW